MKNKLIYLSSMLIILFVSACFYLLDEGKGKARVHQHLTTPTLQDTSSDKGFSSHLPIVNIDTLGQKIPFIPLAKDGAEMIDTGEEDAPSSILGEVSIIDQKRKNQLSDQEDIKGKANISYRGNSSRNFDKKPYKLQFVNDDGSDYKVGIAGMAKDDEWILNGPFLDRTLIRNYLAYNIAGEIMEYAPNVRYCEVFLNGEYQGVYLIIESIKQGEQKLDMEKSEKGKDRTSYIVRWDRKEKGDHLLNNFTFYTKEAGVSALDVKYPGKNKITSGNMKFIESDISKIEKILYSYDLNDPDKGYANYLDRNSFAEYFIINEFFRNVDAGRFSTYYYKDLRGKLKLCVWDFNNAADNYIDYGFDESGFSLQDAQWFNMLLKDEKFVDTIVKKYRTLRKTILSEAYIMKYIDETKMFLKEPTKRNYQVWGYVFQPTIADGKNYLTPLDRNYKSYDESVLQLKTWLTRRGRWLDKHIDSLYQYCQDSKTKNTLLK